ncbi:MAG: class I SAM-dependent methyltransferase [Alphaproteobacteria bacterium]|nr:class I SAM-dependent methyltransferase [Alphaproteobacteria bacterium]
MLFKNLEHGICKGTLHVITPENEDHYFKGSEPGSQATWHIHDWKVVQLLASRGDIGLGESYAAGGWDSPDLEALFRVFIDNIDELDRYANGHRISQFWFMLVNRVFRRNSISGSTNNIRSHYDVGNEFYKLWLDPSMTYSSAIYKADGDSLEQAQQAKYQRILNKIDSARENILEIGCGWGGFAQSAAQNGHQVTGITVSPEQHRYATERLRGAADIKLQDYRHVKGTFEAVASIEMFEAVGLQYWKSYFTTVKERLATDGIAMIQAITVKDDAFDDYIKRGDYIRHYVFPGGMLPSQSRFKQSADEAGLNCREIFTFGQDYAKTLREWLSRFDAQESAIRALGHGNEFIRSWRLYMSMCAASFACGRTNVMQVELVHS